MEGLRIRGRRQGCRIGGGGGNWVEVVADANPLTQEPVIKIEASTQGGRDSNAGEKAGYRNYLTPEVEGAEGILPGLEILKGLFLGDFHNELNNL